MLSNGRSLLSAFYTDFVWSNVVLFLTRNRWMCRLFSVAYYSVTRTYFKSMEKAIFGRLRFRNPWTDWVSNLAWLIIPVKRPHVPKLIDVEKGGVARGRGVFSASMVCRRRISSSWIFTALTIHNHLSSPHRMHCIDHSGLLLQMSHVAWSVCLCTLVSCAKKRLNRSRLSLIFVGSLYRTRT